MGGFVLFCFHGKQERLQRVAQLDNAVAVGAADQLVDEAHDPHVLGLVERGVPQVVGVDLAGERTAWLATAAAAAATSAVSVMISRLCISWGLRTTPTTSLKRLRHCPPPWYLGGQTQWHRRPLCRQWRQSGERRLSPLRPPARALLSDPEGSANASGWASGVLGGRMDCCTPHGLLHARAV